MQVSCYGKLPFHLEYLRIGLEAPGAIAVTRWIDRAHEAMHAPGRSDEEARTTLCFASAPPDRAGVLAGVVRPSSDGRRRHPVTLFVEERPAAVSERWHLLPLALAEVWTTQRALLDRPFQDVPELTEALRDVPGTIDLDAAAADYEAALALVAPTGPWTMLTGVGGDVARHVALNFLAVSEAQREARSVAEGVALTVSLAGAAAEPAVSLFRACLWLDLFRQVAPGAPLPTLLLGGEAGTWDRLWAVYRPAEGTDLAALLSGQDAAAIDELAEAWQEMPSGDAAAALDRLVAEDPAPPSELAARVRSVP